MKRKVMEIRPGNLMALARVAPRFAAQTPGQLGF
jgi:hypothetical protein